MGTVLIVVLVGLGALAAGILAGRYYVPDDRILRRTARHSRAYMRALNHLIARDHDTVLDELRQVVEENVEDSEPYFALGALFRSRGEHERAIRVHQALAVREAGSRKLRLRARYALGLDFRAAGMPRRATRAMEEVIADEPRHEGALRALCGLYEEQGRFADAASIWERLAKLRGEPPPPRHHHLLCAAAQRALAAGDLDSARRLLKEARKAGGESAHFCAAAAELAAARGNPRAAIQRLRQALAADPDLARFLVPGLLTAERQEAVRNDRSLEEPSDDDLEDAPLALPAASSPPALPPASAPDVAPPESSALDRVAAERTAAALDEIAAEAGRNPHLRLAAAELRALYDPAAALAEYRAIAADHPDLLPARVAAARLALAGGDPAAITAELRALVGAGGALTWAFDGAWRCSQCGRRADAYSWRCTGCRRWASARLDVGRDALEPPPARRERRERPRMPLERGTEALLGGTAEAALPAPTLAHSLSPEELREADMRPSLFGRARGWISDAWSGMRKSRAPGAED